MKLVILIYITLDSTTLLFYTMHSTNAYIILASVTTLRQSSYSTCTCTFFSVNDSVFPGPDSRPRSLNLEDP